MSLYQDRISKNLCGACGAENPCGSLCSTCREKSKNRAAAKRTKHRESGGCIACGATPTPGKKKCEKCLQRDREHAKATRAEYKQAGLCQACGKQPPKDGCTLCQGCIDARSAVCVERYKVNRANGKCGYCGNDVDGDYALCEHCRSVQADLRLREKQAAFAAYGGPVCVMCGETDIQILEIDHINGGGCKHKREIKNLSIYRWLKQNDYPPGFRVLCPTCNKKAHVARCGT